jgi:hypothetical protein
LSGEALLVKVKVELRVEVVTGMVTAEGTNLEVETAAMETVAETLQATVTRVMGRARTKGVATTETAKEMERAVAPTTPTGKAEATTDLIVTDLIVMVRARAKAMTAAASRPCTAILAKLVLDRSAIGNLPEAVDSCGWKSSTLSQLLIANLAVQ